MHKIIFKTQQSSIELEDIDFEYRHKNKVFIYKRSSGSTYAMLTRLEHGKWGWVAIGSIDTSPTYIHHNVRESLKLVLDAKRDVRVFEHIGEYAQAVKDGKY